jgi:predicted LPLAT superfamily acyltransferase
MSIKQRGSGWSIKLVYNLYKLFGYTFIYYLMYPVSYFYYLKAKDVKEALSIYYQQIGQEFTPKVHHEHLRHFAICMCDRFVSSISPEHYNFDIENADELQNNLQKGGILLLSHYGGWASSANCFGSLNLKINIVMQEVLMQGIKDIENSIKSKKESYIHIIDTKKGGITVTLEIANALSANELVAMMGDRATSDKGKKGVLFFGKEGYFNKNPFEIAYKMDKPLISLFISYVKPQCYKIDYIKLAMNKECRMDEEVNRCMKIYANRFEMNINNYPQGWFNFYDFWEK